MRALRQCDFCAGDAVGTFEVVPPALEPTEAEQRRVVLCDDCKNRLQTLLEPLLARAGVDADATDADADRSEGAGATGRNEGSAADGSEETAADRAGAPDGGATDAATGDAATGGVTVERTEDEAVASAGTTIDEGGRADADEQRSTETDEGTGAEADDSSAVAFDGRNTTDATNARSTESDSRADSGMAGDEVDSGETTGDEEADDPDGTDRTSPFAAGDRRGPRAYAKVVRLLRNRESPMERGAAESLAASAYDLETHQVKAIIDHAIEAEDLVEEDGVIRQT